MCLGKAVEIDSITRNTDGEVWIFPRIVHGVNKKFTIQHIHIKVLRVLRKIAVQNVDKVVYSAFFVMSKPVWHN